MKEWDKKERRENSNMFTQDEKEAVLNGIKEIKVILTGNGHPENGLVYKTQLNSDFRLFWAKFGWMILTGAVGVPFAVLTCIIINWGHI